MLAHCFNPQLACGYTILYLYVTGWGRGQSSDWPVQLSIGIMRVWNIAFIFSFRYPNFIYFFSFSNDIIIFQNSQAIIFLINHS